LSHKPQCRGDKTGTSHADEKVEQDEGMKVEAEGEGPSRRALSRTKNA